MHHAKSLGPFSLLVSFLNSRPYEVHEIPYYWMPPTAEPLFNALIKTHHITSRKKVAVLRKAASEHDCHVLLRSGASPGIMYVEGRSLGVEAWVATVQVLMGIGPRLLRVAQNLTEGQRLRYKNYQLAARPALVQRDQDMNHRNKIASGLYEVATVKEFANKMSERDILSWWKRGMGYANE